MADDILSQEEVDALLTGVDDGDIATSPDGSAVDCVSYDLTSQDKIVRSRLPTLEVINERMCRHLRASLFAMLKHSVEVEAEAIRVQKYSEYMDALSTPSCLNIVRLHPLRGSSLFYLPQNLVIKLVDIFFGGEGYEPKTEVRDFTPTEYRIVDRFIENAFAGIADSWRQVVALEPKLTAMEINPAMVSVAAPSDAVIINVFKVQLDDFASEFHVVMPYAMIDPIKDALVTTSKAANELPEASWSTALRRDILRASVELGCTVCEREISLRDIVDLQEGDVIPVEIPDKLVLEANGAPIFKVRLGKSRGSLALEVIEKTSIRDMI